MSLIDKFVLIVLLIALGAQILYRRSFGFFMIRAKENDRVSWRDYFFSKSFGWSMRLLWFFSIAVILFFVARDVLIQYSIWSQGEFSRFLLPPHQPIGYFISYVSFRFLAPWLLAFIASFLISRLALILNHRFQDRFFENEEIEFMALGIFLTGYPGFFIYLFLILFFGAIFSLIYTLFSRGRAPLYYFWMPLAVFAMIIQGWLLPKAGLDYFWAQFALGDFSGIIFGF